MTRFFGYSTFQFLAAACFVGVLGRSLFPTISRTVSTILHEIPWTL